MARNVPLNIRLDKAEVAHLERLANRLGLTKSDVVRRLVGAARVTDKPRLEMLDEAEVASVR